MLAIEGCGHLREHTGSEMNYNDLVLTWTKSPCWGMEREAKFGRTLYSMARNLRKKKYYRIVNMIQHALEQSLQVVVRRMDWRKCEVWKRSGAGFPGICSLLCVGTLQPLILPAWSSCKLHLESIALKSHRYNPASRFP
jgi:hypothetical protein